MPAKKPIKAVPATLLEAFEELEPTTSGADMLELTKRALEALGERVQNYATLAEYAFDDVRTRRSPSTTVRNG
jgi:hypothetical protein